MKIGTYETHPAADVFPLIEGADFDALVADIKANGLHEPIWRIWVSDAKSNTKSALILDGRNRARACEVAKIRPEFRDYDGADPIAFVVSMNLKRRHLDESQRAMAGARIATLDRGQPKKPANLPDTSHREFFDNHAGHGLAPAGLRQAEAASLVNVSERSVRSAREVLAKAEPGVVRAVEQGRLAVSAAAELSRLPAEQQREVLARAPSGGNVRKAVLAVQREAQAAVAVEAVKSMTDDERSLVTVCSVADLAANNVDVIITDPPYPREFLDVFRALSVTASRILKPGGSCVVMSGQSYLPEVIAALSESLRYQWTCAYLTPGGQAVQLWERKVNTFWKPLLWFVNGEYDGAWIGDVSRSDTNDNDKDSHHWGQSVSGMADVVERFSKAGDLVCDPFVGGGATAVACALASRRFVGCDTDASCVAVTRQRVSEARAR